MDDQRQPPVLAVRFGRVRRHPELERLICAAICNSRFATLLLNSPQDALEQCEVGQRLTAAERSMVLAIVDAANIYDYAGRLHALAAQEPALPSVQRVCGTPEACDSEVGTSVS